VRSTSDLWMSAEKPPSGCGSFHPENASAVAKTGPKSTLNHLAVMRFQALIGQPSSRASSLGPG
jgi:hypothetical protein